MSEEEINEQQELFEHHRFVVDKGQSLLRIDKYVGARLENTSRTKPNNRSADKEFIAFLGYIGRLCCFDINYL